jgi:hydroxymethylbilane synthase
MASPRTLVLGTRGSPLALKQADMVRTALIDGAPQLAATVEVRPVRTSGDRVTDRPLADVGGKGLFTKELDEALLAGTIDLAVHSMKDVPTLLPDRIVVAAMLPRADPRDVLVTRQGWRLPDLPAGTVLGTASLRRRAQVLAARPDLTVVLLRGNVQTRLAKLEHGEIAATLLAAAGLRRLDLWPEGAVLLEPEEMVPAVAQGAIGVTCREGDAATRGWLGQIDDPATSRCVAAERAMLAVLDGSCRTPIGGLAREVGDRARIVGLVASPDGDHIVTAERCGPPGDGIGLARDLGRELKARADPAWFRL